MLSALLRAGRSLTAGLSGLSTADSILMSYPKLWKHAIGSEEVETMAPEASYVSHGLVITI